MTVKRTLFAVCLAAALCGCHGTTFRDNVKDTVSAAPEISLTALTGLGEIGTAPASPGGYIKLIGAAALLIGGLAGGKKSIEKVRAFFGPKDPPAPAATP